MADAGYCEKWIVYSTPHYSAKELTVFPGRSVTIRDAAAYGLILTQGYGSIGKHEVETPSLIRYGQMTSDELFVTADAAANGVVLTNKSATENLVLLKHFGPGNPDAPSARVQDRPPGLSRSYCSSSNVTSIFVTISTGCPLSSVG